jgi:Glycosyltransferase family 87
MSKTRPMSVLLILLSSAVSITLGILLDHGSMAGTSSYRAVYYGARCILDHADPYNPSEFLRIYQTESGALPSEATPKKLFLRAVMVCVNLPTTLFLVIPLALIPWGLSHVLWLILIALSLTSAALLAFDLSDDNAKPVSLALICILLANTQVLFTVGNTAGLAVGLCVIAVWCFLKEHLAWLGIVAFAVSLALKPHDSGLIWLWLLFSVASQRKRALQVALLAAVIAVPALLTAWHVSPQWPSELASNLASTSSHGDISDPGPDSISRKGSADVIIDLQTVLSLIRDDPHFYNPAVYLICGFLLVVWLITTIRSEQTTTSRYFALAALAPLSMLVSYHRPYDARLLLLAIPAVSILWSEGRPLKHAALLLCGIAITLTGDIPLAILSILTRNIDVSAMGILSRTLLLWLLRPAPVALLAMAIFFLWIYVRRSGQPTPELTFTGRGFQ